jgi:hypothetical protein
VRGDGLFVTLQGERTRLRRNFVRDVRPHGIAHDQFAALRRADQPGGKVHRVAERHHFVGPALGNERTRKHDTGVDADSDRQPGAACFAMAGCAQHFLARQRCAADVIVTAHTDAEQTDDLITHHLVDDGVVRHEHLRRRPIEAVHQRAVFDRTHAGSHLR